MSKKEVWTTGNEMFSHDVGGTFISLKDTVDFVKKCEALNLNHNFNICKDDLVVVYSEYKDKISKITEAKVVCCKDLEELKINPNNYRKLMWVTDYIDMKAKTVLSFIDNNKPFYTYKSFGPSKVWFYDLLKTESLMEEYVSQKIEKIYKFSCGPGADFGNLLQFIDQTKNLNGSFVEIGCYKGSSSCVMANYMSKKDIKKEFFFYDMFSGFDYPEALISLDSRWKNTHETDGIEAVSERIKSRYKYPELINVIKRNICEKDSLREVESISFANIDVDMYEAVYRSIEECDKKMVSGGIIAIEDPGHIPTLLGAYAAMEKIMDKIGDRYIKLYFESGQFILIKK